MPTPMPHMSDERKQGLDLMSHTKPSGSEEEAAEEDGEEGVEGVLAGAVAVLAVVVLVGKVG